MIDKVFLDTNVLIYSFAKDKGQIVQSIIETTPFLQISTQVLNEFINATLRKNILSASEVAEHCKHYVSTYNLALIYPSTINFALEIRNKYQYSYYDSLIISSAIENYCEILYTEDLQHNQIIEDKLTIINPFV